jgi:hypothetical protein
MSRFAHVTKLLGCKMTPEMEIYKTLGELS